MGKTDPSAQRYQQQSMVLVPMSAPGVKVERLLTVFKRYGSCCLMAMAKSSLRMSGCRSQICCWAKAGVLRSRRKRLGPGRIHHCMRCIGAAERALEIMCERVQSRVAFGKPLAEQGTLRAHYCYLTHGNQRAGSPFDFEGCLYDGHGRQQSSAG